MRIVDDNCPVHGTQAQQHEAKVEHKPKAAPQENQSLEEESSGGMTVLDVIVAFVFIGALGSVGAYMVLDILIDNEDSWIPMAGGIGVPAIMLLGIIGIIIWAFNDDSEIAVSGEADEDFDDNTSSELNVDEQAAQREWETYKALHQELRDKAYHAETDWDTLFFYPAIHDQSIPETRAFYEALSVARDISDQAPSDLNLHMDISNMRYPKAVKTLESAWEVAWQNAKKIRQSNLSREERKTIEQIMTLLNKVHDGAATESEKQVAYQRIDVLIDSLQTVVVPVRAQEILAKEQQQALESADTDDISDTTGVTMADVLNSQGSTISDTAYATEKVHNNV